LIFKDTYKAENDFDVPYFSLFDYNQDEGIIKI
jgi:hypothetical protein